MFNAQEESAAVDPAPWTAIEAERRRQEDQIELIAAENHVNLRVMQAQGSVRRNKHIRLGTAAVRTPVLALCRRFPIYGANHA